MRACEGGREAVPRHHCHLPLPTGINTSPHRTAPHRIPSPLPCSLIHSLCSCDLRPAHGQQHPPLTELRQQQRAAAAAAAAAPTVGSSNSVGRTAKKSQVVRFYSSTAPLPVPISAGTPLPLALGGSHSSDFTPQLVLDSRSSVLSQSTVPPYVSVLHTGRGQVVPSGREGCKALRAHLRPLAAEQASPS